MSESVSNVEPQLNFFVDHATAFTNLKMESKEFTEDEFSKEDEEMMECKQIDEQSNDLIDDAAPETIGRFSNEMSPVEDVSQCVNQEAAQLRDLNQLNQLSQLSEQTPQPNEAYPPNADEPKLQSELNTNASSLSALVSKQTAGQAGGQAAEPAGELKPEPGKQPDQHLISSLNSLMQQSNSQQNQQFSQVILVYTSNKKLSMDIQLSRNSNAKVRSFKLRASSYKLFAR